MSGQGYDPVDLQPAGPSKSHYPPNYHDEQMSIPLSTLRSGPSSPQSYDPERAGGMPRPPHLQPRTSDSWDLLSGVRKMEHAYQEFDPARNASEAHLAYAEGDIPNNEASKLYHYLLNVSIVSRWILFIVPVMAIIWIPGILVLAGTAPHAEVWGIGLLWWSIWLSVVWGGWWGALAASMIVPRIIRWTIGLIAVGTRRYLDWLQVLQRYVALFLWTLGVFVSYNPLINSRQVSTASSNSIKIIDLGQKLFFAFFLCAAVLLFEKFSIQWIAGKFHERSYSERIADQKFAVKSIVTLYRNSKNLERSDTLGTNSVKEILNPKRFFKRALTGVRSAAKSGTTIFGNVASEITGSSVLQPNSPQSIVQTALESTNRSRLLARRLFYSFAKPNMDYLVVEDIAQYFQTPAEADSVFALFDTDSNGDASRDEVEMAVMELHREQLSIEHSMQDLDSAVGRLDNIFMSLYVVIAILIIAVALEAQLATLVTSAGTLVLGLSWLIGGTLSEVLTSIIFLFIKHPFDVGDRICLDKTSYTVKEIRLLSTIFIDSNGVSVQAPNTVLNSQFIQNIRRSPQMSESFSFDVAYSTTFEEVELLRQKMLAFVTTERRDYQPAFDVVVLDFPDQTKMTLQADIKYKSNGQQSALKAKRRNKWLCALKGALAELGIYGPSGNPNADPGTQRYTEVPWHEFNDKVKHNQEKAAETTPAGGWQLSAPNAVLLDGQDDIFGDPDELHMTSPRRKGETPQPVSMPTVTHIPPP
ncbi:Mechanosensitive ion channel-domain-containing protein [Mycena alexandri]|uniref:Mechanosensitive ion channel-domain-containing protein n=1 Tax=Mycena alexandri TaxID=1745969 RepID=A0AAD6XHM9_9AGAR|nr:Mechanosensitive ion channel-domain-containing protein [Mycena alexandri]